MFVSYLKIALRNIVRNKFSSVLNIAGLSIGMVCVVLIGLYVLYEKSYDRYHTNARNIYRVVRKVDSGDGFVKSTASCPSPLAPALRLEYPDDVKDAVRFWHYWGLGFNVRYKDNVFNETNLAFTDSTVFKVFDFEFVKGNPQYALDAPFKVVITESATERYFGKEDPIGKSLRLSEGYDLQITGVIKDIPAVSHFHFDFLASYSTLRQLPWRRYLDSWYEGFCYTYILLNDGVLQDNLNERFPSFLRKHLPADRQSTDSYYLQPLVDIHLGSHLGDELEPNGSAAHNSILVLIALFILAISVINYINLTTAYSTVRIREIGVRKVLGSQRSQLILQFLGESMILCFASLLFSLAIVDIILPQFNELIGESLSLSVLNDPKALVCLALFGIAVSFLSGAYPALYTSSFHPTMLLKSLSKADIKRRSARRVLVVSQLIIASLLIIGTITVYKQLKYVDSYDVNFDKDNIIILRVNQTPISNEHYDAFVREITQNPGVVSATGMRTIAGFEHDKEGFMFEGHSAQQSELLLPFYVVRHGFLQTLNIPVVAGRDFSPKLPTDETEAILVNETLVRRLGWANDEAIGKRAHHAAWGDLRIVGVIRDFNFESLHSVIKPLVIKMIWPWRREPLTDYMAVRIQGENTRDAIRCLRNAWKRFAPNTAFEYFFLDGRMAQYYKGETMLNTLSSIFTLVAIVIACLGLLGFVSFIAERKTKEIALRKALGASVPNIIRLISKEFVVLIVIANIVSWPIAYFVVGAWLRSYAYRIDISLWVFVLTAAITSMTAFLAIAFHTMKAALSNPVDHLRYE